MSPSSSIPAAGTISKGLVFDTDARVISSAVTPSALWWAAVWCAAVSLGVAFVFFIGILAGHWGLQIDASCLAYAETFGLVLFVYMLGLSVGPNFFGSLKHEGMSFNLWSMAVIVLGTLMAVILVPFRVLR